MKPYTLDTIRTFKTRNFTVRITAEEEYDLDLSWDDDGSVRAGLESGKFVAFCVKAACYFNGTELAVDYLGNCIYETPQAFMDHRGIKAHPGCGSCFSDMVRNVCRDARKAVGAFKTIPLHA